MMHFGGTVTLNGLIAYIANNLDKVLLGRFWGVDALGIYGRAYQLINIPTENLNSAAGEVAFSALSRLQDDHDRLKNYFLKGYAAVLALTLPITFACGLFADDMIIVLLGPKWIATAPIFRLLAPTILVFAIANPLFWLLSSIGLVGRSLKMSLVIAPLMIGSYLIALPYGPQGVAFAYSTTMVLWIIPLIFWTVHGTVLSVRDILLAVSRPLASSVVAAGLAYGVRSIYGQSLPPLGRLALEIAVLFLAFLGMLLFATGQRALYLDIFRGLRGSSADSSITRLRKSEAS
jgi:PST family polysaccharide transporter